MGQMQREGAGYDKLAPILDYGLLKERFAALLTDGLRAKYLEQSGYETQVLEFIDMEHTPKNILLRAVKTNQAKQGSESQVWECRKFLGIDPMLGVLLVRGQNHEKKNEKGRNTPCSICGSNFCQQSVYEQWCRRSDHRSGRSYTSENLISKGRQDCECSGRLCK